MKFVEQHLGPSSPPTRRRDSFVVRPRLPNRRQAGQCLRCDSGSDRRSRRREAGGAACRNHTYRRRHRFHPPGNTTPSGIIDPRPTPVRMMSPLAHVDQRGMHAKPPALDANLGRQVGELLEGCDERWPAVWIARIVDRIDADEQVGRSEYLGPAQRERQEHGVTRRDIGHRDAGAAFRRHGDVAVGERRPADRVQRQAAAPCARQRRAPSPRASPPPALGAVALL